MKKSILLISTLIPFTLFSSNYKILINDKNYQNNIFVEDYTSKNEEENIVNSTSCLDILNNNSQAEDGHYEIIINGNIINVQCDMTTDGGGWTIIQKRTSNTDFYKTWVEYKNGFGDNNNFWLGNDNIHFLTVGNQQLYVEVSKGSSLYAKYSNFTIANESGLYALTLSGYSGNAGDGLAYHNGRNFTTYDRDNDIWERNCAESYKGAWWHGACHDSNLNGLYTTTSSSSMVWSGIGGFNS